MIHNDSYFRDTLLSLQETFQLTAIDLMDVMFGVKTTITDDWVVRDTMEGTFDYIFRLVSKNDQYKSNTIIGASMSALRAVLGNSCTLDYAKDAFGEFANCYNAMLMNEPLFLKHYDVLYQEVPEDAIRFACFPLAWGIHGSINLAQERIFIRFTIEDKKFSNNLLDSIQ